MINTAILTPPGIQTALEPAVKDWAAANPLLAEALGGLVEEGLDFGIFSSQMSAWAAEVQGCELGQPNDLDLLVTDEHFGDVARTLRASVVDVSSRIDTSDGLTLGFVAREALAEIDRKHVHLVRPETKITDQTGRRRYDTGIGKLATAGMMTFETEQGHIRVAHPFETVAMYGLAQRANDRKDDLSKLTALMGIYQLTLNDPYVTKRASEIGLDERVWGFVARANDMAVSR